jgi:peptidoglycan/xylan/chitin deacetylase (PgdA/CDA1 family)
VTLMDSAGRLPRSTVALTFDDGFSGVYQHAFPALSEHRLPATVFLVAATLTPEGKAIDWATTPPPDATTLSLGEILEMQEAGVTFGSHSLDHHDLTSLDSHACEEDLRKSRELLQALLGRRVDFLAYPRGLHDEKVRRAARRAGYTHSFSLPEGRETVDEFSVPRVVVVPGNRTQTLAVKTSRWYLSSRRTRVFPMLRVVARRTGLGLQLKDSRGRGR